MINEDGPSPEFQDSGYYPRGEQAIKPGDPLPNAYKQWNWAAFAFPWLWGIWNGKPELLVMLLVLLFGFVFPVLLLGYVVAGLYFAAVGCVWAWRSGRFKTPDEMLACQRPWNFAALTVLAIPGLAFVMFFIFAWMMGFS